MRGKYWCPSCENTHFWGSRFHLCWQIYKAHATTCMPLVKAVIKKQPCSPQSRQKMPNRSESRRPDAEKKALRQLLWIIYRSRWYELILACSGRLFIVGNALDYRSSLSDFVLLADATNLGVNLLGIPLIRYSFVVHYNAFIYYLLTKAVKNWPVNFTDFILDKTPPRSRESSKTYPNTDWEPGI